MKIVFNTRYPDSAASYCYRQAFSDLEGITFFDWENYKKYDVALFMSYEKDLQDLVAVKKNNPDIKIGLIDARGSAVEEYRKYLDFFVLDSIEMSDFFAGYGIPIFLYYEYPRVEKAYKKHAQKKTITIGYHGNKLHLLGMYPNLTRALEFLGEKYDIKFLAVYNIKSLGRWQYGLPGNIPVEHVQWHENVYNQEFANVDIGVVPAVLPIKDLRSTKRKIVVSKEIFNDSNDDYLIRFKMLSNPGRIIVFGQLGIPVVADFFPSAFQTIQNGINGFLAYNCGGWVSALEKLILSNRLRQEFSDSMHVGVREVFDYSVQNKELIRFLKENILVPTAPSVFQFIPRVESDLTAIPAFNATALKMKVKALSCRVLKRWRQK